LKSTGCAIAAVATATGAANFSANVRESGQYSPTHLLPGDQIFSRPGRSSGPVKPHRQGVTASGL
jgi:hypothetical protein